MRVFKDISYCDIGHSRQVLDLHLPDREEFSVFIYFHGGGIEAGSKEQKFIEALVNKGVAVVAANYRMYPEVGYPVYLRDAARAVAYSLNKVKEYATYGKVWIGGISAGGYI